jgi:hypothetical protein
MDNVAQPQKQVLLTEIKVTNENEALNLLISFINVAHKRGAYSIDESAKIWECIQFFMASNSQQQPATQPVQNEDVPV